MRYVVGLMALAAAIQVPFFLGPVFGEQDAARLASDALIWKEAGIRLESISQYRYYISPGYIAFLVLLQWIAEAAGLPLAGLMNSVNTALFVMVVVPTFLLFQRLAGREAALLGVVFLLFVPTFWQSGLYGFPHLPALASLITAMWVYDRWLCGEIGAGSRHGQVWAIGGVAALLTLCVLLKGDLYLAGVGILLLHVVRGVWDRPRLGLAGLVLVGPIVISAVVSALLLQHEGTVAHYMVEYERQYPIWRRAVITPQWYLNNLYRLRLSTGFLTVSLFAVSLGVLLWRRRVRVAVFLLGWIPPVLLFWTLRPGDSARHHLPVAVPLALGVGLLLAWLPIRRGLKVAAVAGFIAVNYFAYSGSASTLWPTGRLFENAQLIKDRVGTYHSLSQEFRERPEERKALLGGGLLPYTSAEVLLKAQALDGVEATTFGPGLEALVVRYRAGGQNREAAFVNVDPARIREATKEMVSRGFHVYTWEYTPQGAPAVQFDLGWATSYEGFPDRLFTLGSPTDPIAPTTAGEER